MQADQTVENGLDEALDVVARSLKSGQLDDAIAALSRIQSRGQREGRLSNALAGKLMQAQRFGDAIPFAQHAWLCDPPNMDRAKTYAWALAKAGHLESSIEVLRWANSRAPERSDLKKDLLKRLIQAEKLEEASLVAAEISQLEPDNSGHLFSLANVLRQSGREDEAVSILRIGLKSTNSTENDWQKLLSYLIVSGSLGEAAELAAEIAERWPNSAEAHKRASSLLSRAGKVKDALKFARIAVEMNPNDAMAHRTLSSLLSDLRYFSEAFQHALHAANIEPNNVAYRVFLAHHYKRMGRSADALAELSVALMIDPRNRKALLDFMELLRARGQWSQADLVCQRAREIYPDDAAFVESDRLSLESGETEDAHEGALTGVVKARLRKRSRRNRTKNPLSRSVNAVTTQVRVTWALLLREVQTRYGKTQLGYIWAFLEPLLHIGMLGLSMAVFRGIRAPLGHHFIIFHFTAVVPYLTFVHASFHVSTSRRQVNVLQLPMVHLNDVFASRGILEFLIGFVASVGLLFGFCLAGYEWLPADSFEMLEALFWVWLLGCGIGMINCMICTKFEAWDMVWHNVCRALYFISGVFYLPGYLPHVYLQYLIWNPVLHAIDWNRSAFYNDYHPQLLSKGYLVGCAIISVCVGLIMERVMRKSVLVYQ